MSCAVRRALDTATAETCSQSRMCSWSTLGRFLSLRRSYTKSLGKAMIICVAVSGAVAIVLLGFHPIFAVRARQKAKHPFH
eukprot:3421582-Pleurochrysis_carterae.AAC.2